MTKDKRIRLIDGIFTIYRVKGRVPYNLYAITKALSDSELRQFAVDAVSDLGNKEIN